MNQDRFIFLFEDKYTSEVFNKVVVKIETKKINIGLMSSIKIIVKTQNTYFQDISLELKSLNGETKQKYENVFRYKNYFIENKIHSKQSDGNIIKISIDTNLNDKIEMQCM